ncbi:MAG: ABC transporter permease, partial [Bacillota bacterium]|nr:ABC transporter permease [Bacillota bacterium]
MHSDKIINKLSNKNGISNLIKKITSFRETTVIIIIIIFGFTLGFLSKHFFTIDNIFSIAIGLATEGIVVVGMTIALVSGGLDFSVGSVMSLSGVIVGALFINGINIWLACITAIITAIIFGLLNGFFIGKVGLNPCITTVATLGIARAASSVLTQGSPISLLNVPTSFTF